MAVVDPATQDLLSELGHVIVSTGYGGDSQVAAYDVAGGRSPAVVSSSGVADARRLAAAAFFTDVADAAAARFDDPAVAEQGDGGAPGAQGVRQPQSHVEADGVGQARQSHSEELSFNGRSALAEFVSGGAGSAAPPARGRWAGGAAPVDAEAPADVSRNNEADALSELAAMAVPASSAALRGSFPQLEAGEAVPVQAARQGDDHRGAESLRGESRLLALPGGGGGDGGEDWDGFVRRTMREVRESLGVSDERRAARRSEEAGAGDNEHGRGTRDSLSPSMSAVELSGLLPGARYEAAVAPAPARSAARRGSEPSGEAAVAPHPGDRSDGAVPVAPRGATGGAGDFNGFGAPLGEVMAAGQRRVRDGGRTNGQGVDPYAPVRRQRISEDDTREWGGSLAEVLPAVGDDDRAAARVRRALEGDGVGAALQVVSQPESQRRRAREEAALREFGGGLDAVLVSRDPHERRPARGMRRHDARLFSGDAARQALLDLGGAAEEPAGHRGGAATVEDFGGALGDVLLPGRMRARDGAGRPGGPPGGAPREGVDGAGGEEIPAWVIAESVAMAQPGAPAPRRRDVAASADDWGGGLADVLPPAAAPPRRSGAPDASAAGARGAAAPRRAPRRAAAGPSDADVWGGGLADVLPPAVPAPAPQAPSFHAGDDVPAAAADRRRAAQPRFGRRAARGRRARRGAGGGARGGARAGGLRARVAGGAGFGGGGAGLRGPEAAPAPHGGRVRHTPPRRGGRVGGWRADRRRHAERERHRVSIEAEARAAAAAGLDAVDDPSLMYDRFLALDAAQARARMQTDEEVAEGVIARLPVVRFRVPPSQAGAAGASGAPPGDDDDVDGASSDEDKEECSICLTEFEDGNKLNQLPCKHRFHPKCISAWLMRSLMCPLCRRNAAL